MRLLVLPSLYIVNLYRFGVSYHLKQTKNEDTGEIESELIESDIADTTIINYIPPLQAFLAHIEHNPKLPSVHLHESVSNEFINSYVNFHLKEKVDSIKHITSLLVHVSALQAYFNWLYKAGLSDVKEVEVFRSTKQHFAKTQPSIKKINYVPRSARNDLLRQCALKKDKLILKMGLECGLRAKENQGLRLNDFKDGLDNKPGLLSLFAQLEKAKEANNDVLPDISFPFFLRARFTKGGRTRGRSRYIYFTSELLWALRDYYYSEREENVSKGYEYNLAKGESIKEDASLTNLERDKKIAYYLANAESIKGHDSLFVNADTVYAGKPISVGHASDVFSDALKGVAYLKQSLGYHDCRHTFATEQYYELSKNKSQENALLKVAELLGHALGRNGKAQAVTTKYIRLCDVLIEHEVSK